MRPSEFMDNVLMYAADFVHAALMFSYLGQPMNESGVGGQLWLIGLISS